MVLWRLPINAIFFPSGEKEGANSLSGCLVTLIGSCEPLAGTT